MKHAQSGRAMAGLIVAAAVMAVGTVILFGSPQGRSMFGAQTGGSPRADGKGETIVGAAKYRALDARCINNLSQLRMAIQIATDPVEGTRPVTLDEVRLGADFKKCPVGEEPYEYNPEEGTVKCNHPGHQKH